MTTPPEVEKLGRRIAALEETLENFLQNGVGLGHSSFDNGRINQYTNGQIGSSFGTQYDGSNGIVPLTGPTPPTPRWTDKWGPMAEGLVGGLRVRWEGFFEGGDLIVPTMDHKEVEVHVGESATMDGVVFDTLKTTITSARGGEVLIPMPVNTTGYYVRLRTRTHSGKASAPSTVIGPFTVQKIREEDLGFDWQALQGTKIFWGSGAPGDASMGDLWLKLPQEEAYRNGPNGWELTPDQESVVAALKEAIGDAIDDTEGSEGLSTGDALALVASARSLAAAAQQASQAALDEAAAASGLAQTAKQTADGKITVYRQSSMPEGGAYGANDLWLDSDTNQLFIWVGAWTAADDQRISQALSTANGKTTVFAQDSAPATTGRTNGDIWIETDNGNKQYIWNGAWTERKFGAAAIAATARQLGAITTYRQASAPTSGMIVGDFWIDSDDERLHRYEGTTPTWVPVQDVAIQTAISNAATAKSIADGKMRIFVQDTMPTGLTADDVGDVWIDTDDDNVTHTWTQINGASYAWVKRQISNGAIEPNSLVASDVVATGTISAALLESIMVLATVIIAGLPEGTHTKISPQGVYVYAEDTVDGVPNEVIRMGTDTNDFFGITGSNGMLLLSLDSTGSVNARTGNFREEITVAGRTLSERLNHIPGSGATAGMRNQVGWRDGSIGGITTETGLIEQWVEVDNTRRYLIIPEVSYARGAGTELVLRVRDGGGSSPVLSSPVIFFRHFSNSVEFWDASAQAIGIWDPTTSGTHRLLLTAGKNGGGVVDIRTLLAQPTLIVLDIGPRNPIQVSVNRGGAAQAPPVRQQDTGEMAPNDWMTWRGNGTRRTDTAGPVQGWDPSGNNGDGRGHWAWNYSNITGTVDEVWLYLYADHWYYNSGGTVILNVHYFGESGPTYTKRFGDHHIGGWSKPGGRWVLLPSDWNQHFRTSGAPNGQRVDGITVGPSGGTNLQYYGRFAGSAARLRIKYTQ